MVTRAGGDVDGFQSDHETRFGRLAMEKVEGGGGRSRGNIKARHEGGTTTTTRRN